MTVGDFVDTINAGLLKGGEFGTKKRTPPSKKSIKRFDEDQGSGSNGLLRWKNDRGYLFAIPVDMERTQPGGRVEFATDDANITDWIQSALHGYELRLSKSGKLYVKGRDGLPDELAEIFGRYPTMGQNDGIYEEFADESGGARYETPEALVEALRRDRANYDAWTQGRDAEAEHWAMEEARENAEAAARWEQSGMSVMDYIRSRVEEGDPEFDLDWETAREIERDRAMGRFSVKRSANGEEYSYAALSTKPDMTLTPIDPNRFRNYGNKNGRKISDAKKSIIDAGGFVRDGHYYITLDGEEVEVGSRAITHGIHNLNNEMIFPVLGNVIKNAVKVNELNVREKFSGKGQKDENISAKFVYLGAAAYGNEILPVRIQIDQRNGFKKIESYDVLKSFNTKIGRFASQNKNAPLGVLVPLAHLPKISIANLIRIAQPLHPQIFSRDVAAALGVNYEGDQIQAKFSVGPNTKNEKEYSYDALIQKPNVKAPTVRKAFNEKSNLSQMILEAKRSVISAGGKNTDRGLALNIPAFGDVIVVGKRGIQHGLRPYGLYGDVYEKNNADVLTVLGDVLKGSVPVNELNPDGTENESIVGSTILLGACKTERGITPVISVVNHAKDTNVTPEVYVYPLKSINAQERSPDAFDTHSGTAAQDEISIANLIAIAQPLHPQIFSRDVANALGVSYRGSEISAKYSAGDRAMDGAARNGTGGAAQDLAFDPSMIVYNPKLKAMGEMEQNAGGIAAAIEKKEALRPWTRKDSPCDLAKPIAMDMADMVQFIRAINGAARTPIIRKGEHIPGRPNAIGLNRGVLGVDLCYNTETRGGENE